MDRSCSLSHCICLTQLGFLVIIGASPEPKRATPIFTQAAPSAESICQSVHTKIVLSFDQCQMSCGSQFQRGGAKWLKARWTKEQMGWLEEGDVDVDMDVDVEHIRGIRGGVRTRTDKLTDRDSTAAGGEMEAAGIRMEDRANGGL